jgi:hypothetical protein
MNFDGTLVGALALGVQHFALEPVQRHVAVGEHLYLRAALEKGYGKGEIVWTRPARGRAVASARPIGENVARASSASEAHAMLLASPGHRDNIVNPRFTHVGIGVVVERQMNPPLYAVTEVFAAFPPAISDVPAATTSLFENVRATFSRSEHRN